MRCSAFKDRHPVARLVSPHLLFLLVLNPALDSFSLWLRVIRVAFSFFLRVAVEIKGDPLKGNPVPSPPLFPTAVALAPQATSLMLEFLLPGVSRVLECCQTCGVGGLVFMSSSRVVSAPSRSQPHGPRRSSGSGGGGGDGGGGDGGIVGVGVGLCDENVPLVTCRENKAAYSIAMAETEVLKARSVSTLLLPCSL